jgi:hypothetical protein
MVDLHPCKSVFIVIALLLVNPAVVIVYFPAYIRSTRSQTCTPRHLIAFIRLSKTMVEYDSVALQSLQYMYAWSIALAPTLP